jgi:FlaA1/EpsC-like NDP-sugar epimerase/ADP-ribose pyrophosphatase YjhB (NUDIX family)
MKKHLRNIFDLDQQISTRLRFIFEAFLVFAIYIFCYFNLDNMKQLGAGTHIFNLSLWMVLYKVFGLHKDRLRFSSLVSYLPILKIILILGFALIIENVFIVGKLNIVPTLFLMLITLNSLIGLRVLIRQLIRRMLFESRERILIYGTSEVAIDLANAMAFGKKYTVVGFISDFYRGVGSLGGLPVIPINQTGSFAVANQIKLVVLADQTKNLEKQSNIFLKFNKLGLSVSYAPTIDRAFDYEVKLKEVKPEEVLGRSVDKRFNNKISSDIKNKKILVTGAGGSIGSELCRQILSYGPENLLILELNELALYELEHELSQIMEHSENKVEISYFLGSVGDETILKNIFENHCLDIIYHAAAYKHVPIIEENIVAGIMNNVFGTKLLADFADRYDVIKFVLISTDKAVRPTNVMGATKRLAELIIQEKSKSSGTNFTMVRFGNVLGSSGSVIPKFKKQINSGGPITVTHKEITRYFMSIPEAAHLVLNAGVLSSGGEVFLLDMGSPVEILELAKTMVRQHGLQPVVETTLGEKQRRNNEIAIVFSGLRPGEKLYEELLIDGNAQKTAHPKILKSDDGIIENLNLQTSLELLRKNAYENNREAILQQLLELPLSFQPADQVVQERKSINAISELHTLEQFPIGSQSNENTEHVKKDSTSILQNLICSRFGSAVLHRYFLITRGMTLGVRALVTNDKSEILLIQHTYIPGWHLPGGGVDVGENIEQAVFREVYEECGIQDLKELKPLNLLHNHTVSPRDHVAYFSAKTASTPYIKSNNLEIKAARFFPLDDIPEDFADDLAKSLLPTVSYNITL